MLTLPIVQISLYANDKQAGAKRQSVFLPKRCTTTLIQPKYSGGKPSLVTILDIGKYIILQMIVASIAISVFIRARKFIKWGYNCDNKNFGL